jgi:hypothetical protein
MGDTNDFLKAERVNADFQEDLEKPHVVPLQL